MNKCIPSPQLNLEQLAQNALDVEPWVPLLEIFKEQESSAANLLA